MHLFNKEIKDSYRILVERPEISKLCVSLALHCQNYIEVNMGFRTFKNMGRQTKARESLSKLCTYYKHFTTISS